MALPVNMFTVGFRLMLSPIRVLTAVRFATGTIARSHNQPGFIRHGIEVIYLGYHRSVGDIVRAAIRRTTRHRHLKLHGGHIEFFAAVWISAKKAATT